jgi:hypothetical protein
LPNSSRREPLRNRFHQRAVPFRRFVRRCLRPLWLAPGEHGSCALRSSRGVGDGSHPAARFRHLALPNVSLILVLLARSACTTPSVCHFLRSNFNLRSGTSKVATLLKRGVKVSLGTDVSGGFSLGILTAMYILLFPHRFPPTLTPCLLPPVEPLPLRQKRLPSRNATTTASPLPLNTSQSKPSST